MIMDKEHEEQIHHEYFLEFFGILRESFTIIFLWRKIFSQIILSTIFPLSLLFLGHVQVCEFVFADIIHNEEVLRYKEGFSMYTTNILNIVLSKWIAFWLFKILYYIFFLVLTLLSTSAVVYTVACIYTSKETTFEEVMCVVPKVWRRLLVTFAWNFLIVFAYNMVVFLVVFPWLGPVGPSMTGRVILCLVFVVYLMGFVYISIIWHLASVVTVLEEHCGIEAMIKSKALVKGKMFISIAIFVFLNLCFILLEMTFQRFVVVGESFWSRIGYGIICFFLLSGFILVGLVIQTVVYFICKAFHREHIDKLYLADHLIEVYLGDYAPLRSKDVQLEQFYV